MDFLGNVNDNVRSRKWQITINNPVEKGYDHTVIKNLLLGLKSCIYWCLCDEIGENGTYHTHIYLACSNAVRFSTLKNKFPVAHLEFVRGTSQENRDYILKTGKWEKHRKKETNLSDTFEEWGEMPVERQGARNDLADLYDSIKQGMTNLKF